MAWKSTIVLVSYESKFRSFQKLLIMKSQIYYQFPKTDSVKSVVNSKLNHNILICLISFQLYLSLLWLAQQTVQVVRTAFATVEMYLENAAKKKESSRKSQLQLKCHKKCFQNQQTKHLCLDRLQTPYTLLQTIVDHRQIISSYT